MLRAVKKAHHDCAAVSRFPHTWVSCRQKLPSPFSRNLLIQASPKIEPDTSQNESSRNFKSSVTEIENRAQEYGIKSVQQLAFESNFRDTLNNGRRMMYSTSFAYDLTLWNILLDFQLSKSGSKGAMSIWYGMKLRDLNFAGSEQHEQAYEIWTKILSSAIQEENLELLQKLCEEGKFVSSNFKPFPHVLGNLLKSGKFSLAMVIGSRLRQNRSYDTGELLEIFTTYGPETRASIGTFGKFYESCSMASIYHETTSHLWRRKRPNAAFALHEILLARGDLPPTFDSIEPFLIHLANEDRSLQPFLSGLENAGVSFSAQARRTYSRERTHRVGMSPESLNIVASNTLGVKPRKLSDAFIARAIATRALSFEFVLSALRLMGLIEIGPQSIREIGLSAGSLEVLNERLAKLEALEIDTGSSAYVRLIKKLAKTNKRDHLHYALHTDMHHDVFEDLALQRKLISDSISKGNWDKTNFLLIAANEPHCSFNDQFSLVDTVLNIAIQRSDWRNVTTILSNWALSAPARRARLGVDRRFSQTIYDLTQKLTSADDSLSQAPFRAGFLVGILQDLIIAGHRVPHQVWRQALISFAQTHDFSYVEPLALWIARAYSSSAKFHLRTAKVLSRRNSILSQIFSPEVQSAIIASGFSTRDAIDSDKVLPTWKRSLLLLRCMYSRFGLRTSFKKIRTTAREVLRQQNAALGRKGGVKHDATEVGQILEYLHHLWEEKYKHSYSKKVMRSAAALRTARVRRGRGRDGLVPFFRSALPKATEDVRAGVVVYTDLFHPADTEYNEKKSTQSTSTYR